MINSIVKPVSQSLLLLWTHERGELCNKTLTAAASYPMGTIVDKLGEPIDPTSASWDASQAYGIHMQKGQVYWAHSVFNDDYLHWPTGISDDDKHDVIAHLESQFLIIKQA